MPIKPQLINKMTIFDFLDKHGIVYHDKDLITRALTHTSYVNEHRGGLEDNERLEFMGDAVLQIWVSDKLYAINPPIKEGRMTTKRADLVCEKALASYVLEFGLNQFLLLGQGEEKTGGRTRASVMADMFEALTGAIYLDAGYEYADKFLNLTIDKHINDGLDDEIDYKTKLQEYVQSDSRKAITYEVESVSGTANNPEFTIIVKVDGLTFGKGVGHSKKDAQKNAAKNALDKMVK